MDQRKRKFLQAVLGDDGSAALVKAAERYPLLEGALLPRTIMGWLGMAIRLNYEGSIPGVDNTYLKFAKSDDHYTGSVSVDGTAFNFEKASVYHLGACVAVALGADHERVTPKLRDVEIERLGKNIDTLIKAHAALVEVQKDRLQKSKAHWDTPAFKQWFGNSHVRHPDGKPMVVYHGSRNAGFTSFDPDRAGENTGRKFRGIYFTDSPYNASTYSNSRSNAPMPKVGEEDPEGYEEFSPGNYATYLSMQNPMVVDFEGRGFDGSSADDPHNLGGEHMHLDEIVDLAHEAGHDGVIARNLNDEGRYGQGHGHGDTYVVFHPHQIKSATHNIGTYTPDDADIRKQAMSAGGQEAPGPAHAPTEPLQPLGAVPPVPRQQVKGPTVGMRPRLPKLGTTTPALAQKPGQAIQVTKSEAGRSCSVCGNKQFVSGKFVGCFCFQALAKSVKTISTPSGYELRLGAGWDRESITTLLESMRGER